jgi:hypothetical protein
MTELAPDPPVSAPPGVGPRLLASDQRRDQSVALLSAACADGRLPLEDFSQRVDLALAARTVSELAQLEADLGPIPPPAYAAAPEGARRTHAWFVAIMSSTVKRGHWLLHSSSHALAVMGEVTLDLRGAEVGALHSHITAVAVMGSVKVIVPEGINVEVDGLAVMGNKSVRGGADHPLPGAPTVAITAVAVMGEVTVVTKGPKQLKAKGDETVAALGNLHDHLLDRRQRHAERLERRASRQQARLGDREDE